MPVRVQYQRGEVASAQVYTSCSRAWRTISTMCAAVLCRRVQCCTCGMAVASRFVVWRVVCRARPRASCARGPAAGTGTVLYVRIFASHASGQRAAWHVILYQVSDC